VASTYGRPETPLVSSQEAGASSFGECMNCGSAMTGPYCSQCGEKKLSPQDHSLPHLAEEVLGVFTHLDSRFVRTLRVLLTKPGELSNAYFRGGRSRYTKPLTLFVIINVLFFIVQPHTNLFHDKYPEYLKNPRYAQAVRSHLDKTGNPNGYAARFDANLQNQKKSLLIVSVPLLAVVMSLLLIGSGRMYVEHLVFSVQVYAFVLLYLLVLIFVVFLPLTVLLRQTGAVSALRVISGELVLGLALIAGVTGYGYIGLRRAYGLSRVRAAATAAALSVAVLYLTGVYHHILFWATLWST
jgi:hypothetical protein